MVKGIDVYGVQNLRQTFDFIRGETTMEPTRGDLTAFFATHQELRGRFQRRERAGPREARDRSGRRRRAQPAHDRSARFREIDAIETHRHDHPADVAGGSDREHQDPQHLRNAERRTGLRLHAAFSFAASHHFRCRLARRLYDSQPRRSQPRPSRRPFSRRASRVQTLHARSDAAAA